ncbi:unnamed protein product, partial [Pleuronectes platessa]
AVMGDLLKEIQIMSPEAAVFLKQAGLETDSDIQSLTREDLNELLPGAGDFKLRKNVFQMIQKSRPPNMPQKELGELQNDLATCAVMGDLLKEIHIKSPKAADVLKQAGFETDSDIQSLTREDLNELLPGAGDLRLRKDLFEMIQKSSLSKSLEILPNDNVDPLTNNNTRQLDPNAEKETTGRHQQGAQGDSNARTSPHYFQEVTVKYKMVVRGKTFGAHTQLMDQVKRAPKGDIRLLENSQDSQIIIVFCPITSRIESDVKAAMTGVPGDKPIILVKMHHVCAVMGDLLKEIQIMSPEAADALKQAGFETDSDIQSLTRQDLHELLPGRKDLRLRKNVFDTIHKSSQLTSSEDLPNDNKDPLKNNNKRKLDSIAEKGDSNAGTSPHYLQEVTVKYKMVVGGQTFGAHTQLMDQVKRVTKGDVRLLENSQDSQIIIVFCPITSRVESDVKAAMTGVPGDKPIILVKMHHSKRRRAICTKLSHIPSPYMTETKKHHRELPGPLRKV